MQADSGVFSGWVLGNMIPFWFILKFLGLLRVPANEETIGLDDSYHGGTAYPAGGDDFLDKSGTKPDKINGDGAMNGDGGISMVSVTPCPVGMWLPG